MSLPGFKQPDLLTRALTHRSYLNEHPELSEEDNERLEFLGDAVLDFVVGLWLFRRFPDLPEGRLTSIRAALVRAEKLGEFAAHLGLGEHMRLGKGEADSGGRARQSLLADGFEAVIGALYLDQGLRAVQRLVHPLLADEIDRVVAGQTDRDAKSRLQEITQGRWNVTPHYRTMAESGPDHAKVFTVAVFLREAAIGQGSGPSKQLAAQAAAADALQAIQQRDAAPPDPSSPAGAASSTI